jgi:hypothetical protein
VVYLPGLSDEVPESCLLVQGGVCKSAIGLEPRSLIAGLPAVSGKARMY